MRICSKAKECDVVILCGGKGERLRSIVSDRPKSMTEFAGVPFLTLLMRYVASFGFERFIVGTGYKSEFISRYYMNSGLPWQIVFSDEKTPLGTGGAVRKARPLVRSNPFLVMNGDCFCRLNFNDFIHFHLKNKSLLSMALTKNSRSRLKGKVYVDGAGRIVRFAEKARSSRSAFESAGIYLMDRKVFPIMGSKKRFSLEYDFFPAVAETNNCYGFRQSSACIDFGTPSGYLKAKRSFVKGAF